MLKGLRVPTHRVDAPGVLILSHDDAWDLERIEAEGDELEAAALEDLRREARRRKADALGCRVDELTDEQAAEVDASCVLTAEEKVAARATHPVARYLVGATRYQPDAPDQGPRGVACAMDYLRPGSQPARFELRRIPWRERARIDLESDTVERLERLVRVGLAGVDAGDLRWRAERPTDRVPDDVLAAICDAEGALSNLIALAGACRRYSEPVTEVEGKR